MADTPVKPTDAEQATEADPLLPRKPDPEVSNDSELRSPWQTAGYVLLVVCGAALLGLFLKAFIDADDTDFDLKKALKSALGGGLSGAAAMVIQVLTLMPIRTVMNYQYRYGSTMSQATSTLYADGAWTRFYQGLSAALIQGPVSRFGDTAANAGILALLDSNTFMKTLPSLVKTVFASLSAAGFRMILTPVDTVKTTLQTQGKAGMRILRERVRRYGVGSLFYGAFATAAATFAGHYPWFGTLNFLEANLPPADPSSLLQKLLRRAFIGILRTYRQVNETRIGYIDAARAVIAVDGLVGLFGRGLKTRILANGLQGIMFTVLWKYFEDLWKAKT
ncbi:Mitochondrial carrier [Mycena kentingensis (nom. inval.)]|nr:Mitochondrial carrier [Mycena kentingensis (nom. inval.)]